MKSTVGDPFAFNNAQLQWGRWFSLDGVQRTWTELAHAGQLDREWLYRDAGFLVLYAVLLVLALVARVPWTWIVAGSLMILLPLESGSVTSVGRFGLLAVPVFAGLAWAGRNVWLDRTIRTVSPSLLALASAAIIYHWP